MKKERLTVSEIHQRSSEKLARCLKRERELRDEYPQMSGQAARLRAEREITKELFDAKHPELKNALYVTVDADGKAVPLDKPTPGTVRPSAAASEFFKAYANAHNQSITITINEAAIALSEKRKK